MSIDPDEGTRNHSALVRVEEGIPIELQDGPLGWFTDSGQRPSDEWFAGQEPAWYGWVTVDQPAHNPKIEKAIQKPLFDLIPDAEDLTVTQIWEVVAKTQEEMDEYVVELNAAVNVERDSRVSAGFEFGGKMYDSRPEDQKRISGAGVLALGAIVAGAQVGDFRWHGGSVDFMWLAQDNTTTTMDAQTVFAFGQAAARWESLHIFTARALKDSPGGVPDDYQSDLYWPDPTDF